jgi:hypothetical protein
VHTQTQLIPIGAHSVVRGARRPRECPAFQRPQVRELPLRLEAVERDTFGGLVSSCSALPLRAVLSTTTNA